MKITDIAAQARDKNRVNVSVDGKYWFSLDIFQVSELGVKVGREYSEEDLRVLEEESQFGKIYARTLEYCLSRPRAIKEIENYLFKKTFSKKVKSLKTGKIVEKKGISPKITSKVLQRLIDKKYLDDEKFAKFWLENRFLKKGASLRRLRIELAQKGIKKELVEQLISESVRNDADELAKIIAKKRYRYPDQQKFIQYLARQGFSFDEIKDALVYSGLEEI